MRFYCSFPIHPISRQQGQAQRIRIGDVNPHGRESAVVPQCGDAPSQTASESLCNRAARASNSPIEFAPSKTAPRAPALCRKTIWKKSR
jgi:hypothetical protein